jgi:hypothetical protein
VLVWVDLIQTKSVQYTMYDTTLTLGHMYVGSLRYTACSFQQVGTSNVQVSVFHILQLIINAVKERSGLPIELVGMCKSFNHNAYSGVPDVM